MNVDYKNNEPDLKRIHTFQTLATYTGSKISPLIRKKSGFELEMLENWSQIVGEPLSQICTPLKITRTRKAANETSPAGASLSLVCEGLACLKVRHQAEDIIKRINLFLGYPAIDKIKIVQKSHPPPFIRVEASRILSKMEIAWLEEQAAKLDDEALRVQIVRLGKNILEKLPAP